MMKRIVVGTIVGVIVSVGIAHAQETGQPSFSAPYRTFSNHEVGGNLTFRDGGGGLDGTAIEGRYRFGRGKWDIGFRGGIFDPSSAVLDATVVIGASARQRVLTHDEKFPLDGAVILGFGLESGNGGTVLYIPAGLSLGRQVTFENSQVVLVPYVQPTLFITAGDVPSTELNFTLGLGADLKLSPRLALNLSFGVFDIEGVSLGATFTR